MSVNWLIVWVSIDSEPCIQLFFLLLSKADSGDLSLRKRGGNRYSRCACVWSWCRVWLAVIEWKSASRIPNSSLRCFASCFSSPNTPVSLIQHIFLLLLTLILFWKIALSHSSSSFHDFFSLVETLLPASQECDPERWDLLSAWDFCPAGIVCSPGKVWWLQSWCP